MSALVGTPEDLFSHNEAHLIKQKLLDLIEWTFEREGTLYLTGNDRKAFSLLIKGVTYKLWSCQK